MVVAALQTGAIATIAVYLGSWRSTQRRRRSQSWEALIARLQPDWSARGLSEHFPWKEGLSASPEDTWQRIDGTRGLWAMYKNAGVMLEMASYAAENSDAVDPILLQTLRADATQIRCCALITLAQCVFSQASESVRINAFRAASIYTGMAARMTQLLQETADSALPDFVAAM
jgi:hypothetical protein